MATKINIVSSSFILAEGLKSAIRQLTSNHLIFSFYGWLDFLSEYDASEINQVLFIEIKTLPKKERLKSLTNIVSQNTTIILLHSNDSEVENFNDFFSIPVSVSKEDLSKKLNQILSNTKSNITENNVLSEREITILKEVALGLTNKEISDRLCISMHTVITHRKNITAKLGIKTISGLTVYAILNNIISPTALS